MAVLYRMANKRIDDLLSGHRDDPLLERHITRRLLVARPNARRPPGDQRAIQHPVQEVQPIDAEFDDMGSYLPVLNAEMLKTLEEDLVSDENLHLQMNAYFASNDL
jgi:hypothetical protein